MKKLSVDAFLTVLAIGSIIVVAYWLIGVLQGPRAPVQYTERGYAAERAVYAPGETLTYTPTLKIRREGFVRVVRSYWDEGRSQSARLCDGSAAPVDDIVRNLPAGIVGDIRGGRSVRTVVPALPPGDYLLIASAIGPDGGQSAYEVRFRVARPCGAGG